jgi:hypothetical protein
VADRETYRRPSSDFFRETVDCGRKYFELRAVGGGSLQHCMEQKFNLVHAVQFARTLETILKEFRARGIS